MAEHKVNTSSKPANVARKVIQQGGSTPRPAPVKTTPSTPPTKK